MDKLPRRQDSTPGQEHLDRRDDILNPDPAIDNPIELQWQRQQYSKSLEDVASRSETPRADTCNRVFEGYVRQQATEEEATATELLSGIVPAPVALRLYTSHFFSTWNSRLFEFGAVLFLASIFPETLLPMSVYALVRSSAAIVFAQTIGSWIDRGDRLVVVRTSIIGQRLTVAASCGLFWALAQQGAAMDERLKHGLFALTVVLACGENVCSVMNLVSVERDWVWNTTFIVKPLAKSPPAGCCHHRRQ